MERLELSFTLQMESYIAHPYWPETADVIDVQKKSGMNNCRTDATRAKALAAYLDGIDMTPAEYDALVAKSRRQWYRVDSDDMQSPIVIPRHHLSGAFVEAIGRAPSAARKGFKADSFRHHVRISDAVTTKTEADRVFDRYVKLETSNQRSRQKNEVIESFEATGLFEVSLEVKADDLKRMFKYAMQEVGVGASRKMGYGRGEVATCGE